MEDPRTAEVREQPQSATIAEDLSSKPGLGPHYPVSTPRFEKQPSVVYRGATPPYKPVSRRAKALPYIAGMAVCVRRFVTSTLSVTRPSGEGSASAFVRSVDRNVSHDAAASVVVHGRTRPQRRSASRSARALEGRSSACFRRHCSNTASRIRGTGRPRRCDGAPGRCEGDDR